MGAQTVAGTHQETSVAGCDTMCSVPPSGPNRRRRRSSAAEHEPSRVAHGEGGLLASRLHREESVGRAIKISFSSSQRFDIVAIDSTSGKGVDRVGEPDLTMAQDEVVPGNGALVYTASSKPSARGCLFHATLASTPTCGRKRTTSSR